jgi:UDP-N-acetylmuramoyl-tripeptide--D-alanyl-D-alanine ligase
VKFELGDIARAVSGTLAATSSASIVVSGVSTDSREVTAGELFVPIVAERDGHDFIDSAIDRGAAGFLTAADHPQVRHDRAVVVPDTTRALQELGRHGRSRLPNRVAAVTGSVGKTSTKDLLGAILRVRANAVVSAKSFNNELGVPLTILNGPDDAWAGVLEMGARGPGHISFLCDIARPTVGVITNIGSAHLELFGSREVIADSKSELVASLPADGVAVLNLDSDLYARMASHANAPIVSFSAEGSNKADVFASNVHIDDDLRASFSLTMHGRHLQVSLAARGRHQVANALAAAAAAHALGSTVDEIIEGLSTSDLSPMRMELVTLPAGTRLLNDTYNANPVSMRAAIDALMGLQAQRRIAILGTMAELGPDRAELHREIAQYAASVGVDVVLSVNESTYGVETLSSIEDAVQTCTSLALGPDDAVLVKGSRVAELERLVQRLLEGATR